MAETLASLKARIQQLEVAAAKAKEDLSDLALRDGLTRAFNHRHLYNLLDHEIERARRYSRPLSFIMIDIDYFKAINDNYGHKGGDTVLMGLAEMLVASVRAVDAVARYGGDEFAILLPETDLYHAGLIASRILKGVQSYEFRVQGQAIQVSLSIGVASLADTMVSKDDLITAADRALYEAKHRGRNTICTMNDLAVGPGNLSENLQIIQDVTSKIRAINHEVRDLYLEMIKDFVLVLGDYRGALGAHSVAVATLATRLGRKIGLGHEDVRALHWAGILHDIGKIAIDQKILNKTEKLTPREHALIQRHPILSARLVKGMNFLDREVPLILHHHEHFDGNGYPSRLKKEEIPPGARVLHLAEAWDTMTRAQPYRAALSRDAALEQLKSGRGGQFDPEMTNQFMTILETEA